MTETEVTVAELLAREGRAWPAVDGALRHLLDEPEPEPEPQPGDLLTFWADSLLPRRYAPPITEDGHGG